MVKKHKQYLWHNQGLIEMVNIMQVIISDQFSLSLYPRPTKLEGGYTGFTLSVRLSVCPSVRLSVRLSVDGMVSGA